MISFRAACIQNELGTLVSRLTNTEHSNMSDDDLIEAAMPGLDEHNRIAHLRGEMIIQKSDIVIGNWSE